MGGESCYLYTPTFLIPFDYNLVGKNKILDYERNIYIYIYIYIYNPSIGKRKGTKETKFSSAHVVVA
jgi:hypothetical protein